MLISVIILALYFWAYFADVKSIGSALLVNDISAITAGIGFVAGFISYLWAPKKYIFWGSLGAYGLLCVTTATLIVNTGGVTSPFIALWMLISVFAGVFGAYGLLPLFLAITSYMLLEFSGGTLGRQGILTLVLAGELPLAVSFLIWHTKSKTGSADDKAYHDLASELSQVANKAEVVINAIADGVIALDSKGVIQLINPAAQQIIGWGKQDALQLDYKSVLKLVDKKDSELTPANDPIAESLVSNKEINTNDIKLITNSGKKILTSIVVSPVGQLGSGVIVVFRDITKEKAEEREQAEFISTASHEMRTPVASIEGYLGLALNPATAQVDEKARDFINKAHESAQHLGRLFQDLLDVSKAEDGRLSNNPKIVDVVAFTHDIVQGLKQKADEKGLRTLFKPLPDDDDDEKNRERRLNPVFYVNVDNDHLREVIANLVENAIKYTPKGDVVIDVNGDDEHVTVSVADSGIGIPKEDQVHLFQKFYRVDNTDTREIGGTGLGLYLCRRLTEAMNGRIWLDSEYKKGSTFYVELPRVDHEEAMRLIEAASIQEEQRESGAVAAAPIISEPTLPVLTSTPQVNPLVTPPSQQPIAPAPAVSPDNASDEAVYTTAPVDKVVEQLQSVSQIPQPQATPLAAPIPLGNQAAPQPQYTPLTYAPPLSTTPHTNVPLSNIEQNPGQYLRARPDGVPVPPRNQN
ncbi:MAG: putative sensor protein [Candidatus Saccharibacteria bacterium]|nr:putative sensor protein [Candidatus Saccharibacteria bacterium]